MELRGPDSASNTATTAQASHTYLRAGTYTVTLTVTDAGEPDRHEDVDGDDRQHRSAIAAFAGATLLQGESYAATGTFADADPDSWTATVDYGEGSGAQALALAGKQFSLGHRYTAAGSHTVEVTVSDTTAAQARARRRSAS
jgi:hypothetical protein